MTLYHGSPQRLEKLEPRSEHGDPRVPEAVFGTPDRGFALAYAGRKWGDRDINQEMRGGPHARMTLREMRPGALQEIYGGQTGYIHHLPDDQFEALPGRRTTKEVISRSAITPTKIERVRDVLQQLRQAGVELVPYNSASSATRNAVRRQVSRMLEMLPEDRENYRRWRLENAPSEMKALFDQEYERQTKTAAMKKPQVVNSGSGEFAPGIPQKRLHPLPVVKSPQTWEIATQQHHAVRSGLHTDLRLVDPHGVAHSWAIPKARLPAPGEKVLAVPQPPHSREYSAKKGEFRLTSGYGQGTVVGSGLQPVEVLESRPGYLRFNVYGGQKEGNQEYSLVPTPKGNLLVNHTSTAERGAYGQAIPNSKPDYREIKTDAVRFDRSEEVHQAKVDGAHVSVILEGNRPIKFFSHRPTDRATGVLEHSHKLPDYHSLKAPSHLSGTVVRGELYGADLQTGKALPAELTGGLLNASVWKSRARQKELGAELRPVIFDVVKYRGKSMEDSPYAEKLKVLQEIQSAIPRLRLPPTAVTSEAKRQLFNRIQEGKEPITEEGIISWNLRDSRPTKAKFRPDVDAEVVGVTPGQGKFRDSIGALKVKLPDKDAVTHVGTGMSEKLRKEIADHPERYIGKAVKVRTLQVFPSGKLRAPSFGGFHLEKGKQDWEKTSASKLRSMFRLAKTEHGYNALLGDKQIGFLHFHDVPDKQISFSSINPEFQGMGLGRKMYGEAMRRAPGGTILSGNVVSPDAQRVWQRLQHNSSYKVDVSPKSFKMKDLPEDHPLYDPTHPEHLMNREQSFTATSYPAVYRGTITPRALIENSTGVKTAGILVPLAAHMIERPYTAYALTTGRKKNLSQHERTMMALRMGIPVQSLEIHP